MTYELSASVAWGIDLGPRAKWTQEQGDIARFAKGEASAFEDFVDDTVDRLFVDAGARQREFVALYARTAAAPRLSPEAREVYMSELAAIAEKYPIPVVVMTYGINFASHAIVIARSIASSTRSRAGLVEMRTIGAVSATEMAHLRRATEAIGYGFRVSEVKLLILPSYC